MSFSTTSVQMNDSEDYLGKLLEGTVIDIDDPEGTDRVKATVPGLYSSAEDCPWIGPAKKSPFGSGSGFGTFGPPQLGSTLIIELQDGDQHYPIYHGSLLKSSHKTAEQKSKFHPRAWGFEDPDHNRLVVDLAAHTTTFTSSSGVQFHISASGSLTVTVPQNVDTTVGGNLTASISGNATLNVGGSLQAQVGGSANLEASGEVKVKGSKIVLNG